MGVRLLAERHIPQVADLYWQFMRHRDGSAPIALHSFLLELYFHSPFSDPAIPSLIYEDGDGRIIGFLGGITRWMSFRGRPIRAAFGGNLLVHPKFRSGIATARLVDKFLHTDCDMVMTDSANDLTKKILERRQCQTIPALNIHWVAPLQPTRFALEILTRSLPPAILVPLNLAAKPFSAAADLILTRLPGSPFRRDRSSLRSAELDVETLLAYSPAFHKAYSLTPEYDACSLQWLLKFMGMRPNRGKLRQRMLHDEENKVVGWYIYYVKAGGIGEVVQVDGERRLFKQILNHLFHDATEQGVIGLHGTAGFHQMPDLSDQGCLFTCRGGWTIVTSRNDKLLEALARGEAWLSRLDGEWCLDPGD